MFGKNGNPSYTSHSYELMLTFHESVKLHFNYSSSFGLLDEHTIQYLNFMIYVKAPEEL